MIPNYHGMTQQEYDQALSYDYKDCQIESLRRELIIAKQDYEIKLMLLEEDIQFYLKEMERYKKMYIHAIDYKIFS